MWSIVRTLLPVALLTAVMYGAVVVLVPHITSLSLGVRFVVEIAVGVAVYVVGAVAFRVAFVGEIIEILRRMLHR